MIGTGVLPSWEVISEAGPKVTSYLEYSMEERKQRDIFIEQLSFAVPSQNAIDSIAKHTGKRRILEIGAGSGLWAGLLAQVGLQVTATDDQSWKGSVVLPHGYYYPVECLDAIKAIRKYADHDALLLCWPDYGKSWPAKALRAFQGDRLIFIGEGDGGCTGDEDFHKLLSQWPDPNVIKIPQWWGIHDCLYLYARERRKQ